MKKPAKPDQSDDEPEEVGTKTQSAPSNPWWVYVIETEQGHYYTGITTDVLRRFREHCAVAGVKTDVHGCVVVSQPNQAYSPPSSKGRGAKYFRSQTPRAVVYQAVFANRSEASKEEARIKKLSKRQKIALVHSAQK